MSTEASKNVKERIDITIEVLKENDEKKRNLTGKEENDIIKNKKKNIEFPKCIDAYKRVARLYIQTEKWCPSCLQKLKESNLKLSNGGADILLLKKEPFIKIMSEWAANWSDLTRDEATRKIGEYIEENFKIQGEKYEDLQISRRLS